MLEPCVRVANWRGFCRQFNYPEQSSELPIEAALNTHLQRLFLSVELSRTVNSTNNPYVLKR